jgi:hypothetical protein
VLVRLCEASPDLLDAALIAADGTQISSTDGADWALGARGLWAAADRGAAEPASQIHVGTGDGEVFAVRGESASIVATSRRFALASLMLCDLRAALRQLAREDAS